MKEFIINIGLGNLNFNQLSDVFLQYQLPHELIQYVDEMGVVPSDRMLELKEKIEKA